jgi:SAM-dependent methyltransferase
MADIASITSGLQLGEDGIWHSTWREAVSYPIDGNDACYGIEEDSFWFMHRNDCIASVVTGFPPAQGETIFDIGGGNGFVAVGLIKAGFDVALIEPGPAGAANAKKRGVKDVICATTGTANIRPNTLGAVGLFDVIEHVEDDTAFLASMRKLVKPGGWLYATVPAYAVLWSEEDDRAGHFRRYTSRSIGKVIAAAGFEVVFNSYIFRPLPLPILLSRALPYRLCGAKPATIARDKAGDHKVKAGLASRVLGAVLRREIANLENRRAMRFGGSCIVAARAA